MKRRAPPDTRPRWNDPALPCIREYRFANGKVLTEVDPDYERRYREHMMEAAAHPRWDQDEIYYARKKRV